MASDVRQTSPGRDSLESGRIVRDNRYSRCGSSPRWSESAMWGESKQLQEMVSLLRQLVEQSNRSLAERAAIAKQFGGPSQQTRLDEIKKDGDIRRREEQEFRESLLALLGQLAETLARIMRRLDEFAESRE
jgi:hypothetical protein